MKLVFHLSVLASIAVVSSAFAPTCLERPTFRPSHHLSSFHETCSAMSKQRDSSTTSLRMSDFASAMPEKPQQTLEEYLVESSEKFCAMIRGSLGEGVEPPPELEALEQAAEEGASKTELSALMYELMIERGMLYDEDQETGILTPTNFDIPSNLDVPEVKKEFSYLYSYGLNLISRGLLDVDKVKEIVNERLISRTGLSPEKFDEWMGF